jgi:hypothetical protein
MSYGGEERIGLRISVDSTETKAAEKRVAELHRELDALAKQYQGGSLSAGQYLKATAALNRELEQVEKRLPLVAVEARRVSNELGPLYRNVATTADGFGRGGMMVYQFGQAISDMSYGLAYGLNNISMIAAMMGVGGAFGIGIQVGIAGLEVLSRNWGSLTKAVGLGNDSIEENIKKLRQQGEALSENAKKAKEIVELEDERAASRKKASEARTAKDKSDLERMQAAVGEVGGNQAAESLAKSLMLAGNASDIQTARTMAQEKIGDLMGARGAFHQDNAARMLKSLAGQGSPEEQKQWLGDDAGTVDAMTSFGRSAFGGAIKFGTAQERAQKRAAAEAVRKQIGGTPLDAEMVGGAAAFGRMLPQGIREPGDAIREQQRKQEQETEIEGRNETNAAIAKAKEEEKQKRRAIAEAAAAGNREAAQAALQANPGIADDVMGVMGAVGVSPRAQAVIRKRIALLLKANGSTAQGADLDAMVSEILTQMLMVARAQGAQSRENAIIRQKIAELDLMNRMIAEDQRRSAQTLQRMGR